MLLEQYVTERRSQNTYVLLKKGKGYRLYRYRPYLQELLEIESGGDLQEV
jgi:hypothetical protein